MTSTTTAKIRTRDELSRVSAEARQAGRRVGFTSGVFDLLHPGHVAYLEAARARCDLLIVGINSDHSVRANKGDLRPICPAADRAAVVAGLAAVDLVFVFDERNNEANIAALRPALYLKAGDYDRARLTSAPLVESYGGRVELVPFVDGRGTTGIIDRILDRYLSSWIDRGVPRRRPAVFLDRDGTINEHVEYLHEPEKLRLIPGALEGLKHLKDHGFRLVVVTNQPGIGLGYFTREDFFRVNRVFLNEARRAGVLIDRVYFCPHSDNDRCECRKPGIGLIRRAVEELNIDLEHSFMVGDMTADVALAKAAGIRSVLVQTGMGGSDRRHPGKADFIAPDLQHAAAVITAQVPVLSGEAEAPVPNEAQFDAREAFIRTQVLEGIGRVSGRLAHDFNNYAGAIRGCVDVMAAKARKVFPEGNPFERQLQIIGSALDRALELTTRLRGFVRPGEMCCSEVDLGATVRSVITLLEAKQTTVVVERGPIDRLRASVDDFAVTQVLVGLSLNAIDAVVGGAEARISLSAEATTDPDGLPPGRYARITVGDRGAGLPAAVTARIGEPFVSTRDPVPGEGFGLTLAMAGEIARRHKGDLRVRSSPGQGTTVELYLPCVAAPQPSP